MATDNPLWGEERIANELSLKLGIRLSPGTVRQCMPQRAPGRPRGDERRARLLRDQAKAIIACDLFVAVAVTFQLLYAFVLIQHGSLRLVHFNVTAHPAAAWTLHTALGPGVPDAPAKAGTYQPQRSRPRTGEGLVVLARSVLGGLPHEYSRARAIV